MKTFLEHLLELRTRLLIILVVFIVASFISFFFYDYIYVLIARTIDQPLFYTSPTGAVDFAIRLSMYVGFLFTLPVLSFQIFRFIQPAFSTPLHRVTIMKYFVLSVILGIFGVCYAYFFSLPATMFFLKTFGPQNLQAVISAQEYLSFALSYIVSFALLFQVPLILLCYNHFRQIPLKRMLVWEPYVILISFIFAAFITPTSDVINQILFAAPPIALYQLSLILVVLINLTRNVRNNKVEEKAYKLVTRRVAVSKDNKETFFRYRQKRKLIKKIK